MKQTLLALFLALSFSAQAQRNRSGDISIISLQPVMVAIDNRVFHLYGTDFTIGNIPMGAHKVQLYSRNTTRGRNSRGALLYETNIRVEPGQRTIGEWDTRRRILKVRTEPKNYQDFNSNYEPDGRNYPPATAQDNPSYPGQGGPDRDNRLSSQQLADLHALTERIISDGSKVESMKKVLTGSTYAVAQVSEMTGWLSFDSNKLDFLKWAYTNTEDKENYTRLYSLLTFESSIKELTDYVYRQRR